MKHTDWKYIVLILFFISVSVSQEQFCTKQSEKDSEFSNCQASVQLAKRPRFILYDVNPPEGFNLRRDVYMRMAIFVSNLPKNEDWHLVLPPWTNLYHWRSTEIGKQSQLPWGTFFDVPSLQKFAPVIEMDTFLSDFGQSTIEQVYILQHFQDTFNENFKWEEKFQAEPCRERNSYRRLADGSFAGRFWGYVNVTAAHVSCVSFHGLASQLAAVAGGATSVMFDRAEVVLHDAFGGALYWRARRSMRFSGALRRIALDFRRRRLRNARDDGNNGDDGTELPDDWRDEKGKRDARGGAYLCAHLRRRDFLARGQQVPSVRAAAVQLRSHLQALALDTLFVATDATQQEIKELKEHLLDYQVVLYEPPLDVKEEVKDGGVAIIEQIICSHAAYFIGTHESTFSFRIQEEREILGFPVNSTFNRLCGDAEPSCSPPTAWKIVY